MEISTADNLLKNLPIDFKLQKSGWIKGWVVLGGNSCWGGWWVVWWLRWGKACRLPLCWASTHFKPHLGFRNQRNTVYTKKRNRINRIREIHGGWWCGRKVACYQLSGCCGRSSQASTSIWTPHLAFPFPHHHTAALPQTRFLQTIFFQTVFLHHTLPFLFHTTTLLLCHTVNQHKTNPTHYLLNFACILLILLNYLLYHLKDKNIILAI